MKILLRSALLLLATLTCQSADVRMFNTLADLAAWVPSALSSNFTVRTYDVSRPFATPRPGHYDPTSTAATNAGCVFATSTGTGRNLMDDCNGGEIAPEWFGGKAGFLTNATDAASLVGVSSSMAVQAATDYLSAAGGGVVKFGPGTYWFDEPVQVKPRVHYRGQSSSTGFIARRDLVLGETARIGGVTYIEGYRTNAIGFPLFVLSGNLNYTNMFSESFVNRDGDTVYYRSCANSFDSLILTVYQWGWGSTNNLPVAGIVADQVDGVKIRNCGFWNIAGTGIWAHGARGMIVDSCWFMNCLVESVQVMYTSDTRIFNCGMGVGGVVYYRANTHVVQGSEIWNPDQSLVNYAGGSAATNISEFGTTRAYAIERTIVSDSVNDWFQGTTPIGADTGTLVYFTGTSVPAPFATNTPYFAITVPGVTNAVRLATSPLNALAGTYVSVTDSATNGTWHLTGTDSCIYGYDGEELLIQGNRMDQSFRHVVELHRMNRSIVSDNWMWEVGANMGPARRSLYMGNDTIFAGVLINGSGNIQVNDNLITGGYAFSSRLDQYKVPNYGVWSVGSGDVSVIGNRFKWLNVGVYSDAASINVRESGNSYDPSVARPADAASTAGNNARRWDGVWLKGTNIILSGEIPAAFTNLQDFTIVIDTEQGLPSYVGSTNEAYSPLLVLGTSTNYASLTAFTENSFALSQYLLTSFSTNWLLINNIQGAGTNYRRSSLTYLSEWVAKSKPMELIIGRTNFTWYIYVDGYFAQFTNAVTQGPAPPASDAPIHASRLILGYWPVLYRSGWIGRVQLYNRSFGYNDFLYERFRNYGTNLVLNWDFHEDSGNTVIDKSGNGVNGTVISLDGTTLHEFGPRDTKTVLDAPTGAYYIRTNGAWDATTDVTLSVAGLTYSSTNLYEDLQFNISTLNPTGPLTGPTIVDTSGRDGEGEAAVFNTGDVLQWATQMPHTWVHESTIYPHLHVEPQTVDAITNTWIVKYSVSDIGQQFPTWTLVTNTVVIAAGQQWVHKLIAVPTNGIPMTGKNGPSTVVRFRASLTSNVDTHVLSADVHYRVRGSPVAYVAP